MTNEIDQLNNWQTNEVEPPILICDSLSSKGFAVQFLKSTKSWDHVSITIDYKIAAKDVNDVTKLINNIRVYISRMRGTLRQQGKQVPPFMFTSKITQETTEPNQEGYLVFNVTLGKSNSPATQNRLAIEELF